MKKKDQSVLTPTEKTIVEYIQSEALSNLEISERLGCMERTVESHIRNINIKLKTRNRTEIAIKKLSGE
jgi:DNA-binding CsgD family transcriptional regulator